MFLFHFVVQADVFAQEDSKTQTDKATRKLKDEKPPFEGRKIASVNFRGNTAFSMQALKDFQKYAREGDAYRYESLQVDLDRLRVLLYADNGYLQARFGEPEIADSPEGIHITIPVTEGLCYRAGDIKVEDGTLLTPEQTLEIIGIKTSDMIKGYSVVHNGLERLRLWYGERGYIQYDTDFIPEFRDIVNENGQKQGIADLTFIHDEGARYFISKIKFVGVDEATEAYLRAQLFIREGDLCNKTLLYKSIERINEMKKLEEEDITVNMDEKNQQVELVFKLGQKKTSPPILKRKN